MGTTPHRPYDDVMKVAAQESSEATLGTITITTGVDETAIIHQICWSYNVAGTTGRVFTENLVGDEFDVDVVAAGPDSMIFIGGLYGQKGTSSFATVKIAAVTGSVGKLTVLYTLVRDPS